jgi:pimeloyl-ACP methyl ester carboxylesterase
MRKRVEPGLAGELCRFETPDGLELHGFLCAPARARAAVVHVHGWDGNFYENRFVHAAARAAGASGFAFFTFNNRGHDYIADILRPAKGDYLQLGGMYERLGDCRPDIRGALRFLVSRELTSFVLQGHSHGAVKVTHYLHRTRDRRVIGLALLSPSDDLGWGRDLPGARRALALARRLVRAGRGRELLPEGAFPYPVSALTLVDALGDESLAGMFNVGGPVRREFPELGSIRVPVFIAAGTVEEAFAGEPACYLKHIAMRLSRAPSIEAHAIEGAPHSYLGREAELAARLGAWLRRLGPADGRRRRR